MSLYLGTEWRGYICWSHLHHPAPAPSLELGHQASHRGKVRCARPSFPPFPPKQVAGNSVILCTGYTVLRGQDSSFCSCSCFASCFPPSFLLFGLSHTSLHRKLFCCLACPRFSQLATTSLTFNVTRPPKRLFLVHPISFRSFRIIVSFDLPLLLPSNTINLLLPRASQ